MGSCSVVDVVTHTMVIKIRFAGFHMADRYLVMHSCFSTHLNESISQLYENLLEPGTGAWLDTVGWEDRSEFYLGYFFGK